MDTFDLNDLIGDIQTGLDSGDIQRNEPQADLPELPGWELGIVSTSQNKVKGINVVAAFGRGAMRLRDRSPLTTGKRTYEVEISAPAMIEIDGTKYQCWVQWGTGGGNIGLQRFTELLEILKTQDPKVACVRLQRAKLRGLLNGYRGDGTRTYAPNYTLSFPKIVELPNIEQTDTSQVNIRDQRKDAPSASRPSAPAVPNVPTTPSAPQVTAPDVPTPGGIAPTPTAAPAADKPFWEQ